MSGKVVLALVKDLFFRSKLDVVAEQIGAEVAYASDLDAAARRCVELKPSLVIVDLSDPAFPAAGASEKIRTEAPGARLVGFASHVDLKPLRAAKDAGFTLSLSRSEFTAQLADLLKE